MSHCRRRNAIWRREAVVQEIERLIFARAEFIVETTLASLT
jgi:hypothetical protein